jgi:antitoxin PrlF
LVLRPVRRAHYSCHAGYLPGRPLHPQLDSLRVSSPHRDLRSDRRARRRAGQVGQVPDLSLWNFPPRQVSLNRAPCSFPSSTPADRMRPGFNFPSRSLAKVRTYGKECYPYSMEKSFTSVLTSKGQITIPQEIRRRLGLKKGDRVEFVTQKDRTVVRRAKAAENPFKKYEGILGGFPGGKKEINAWVREMRDDYGDQKK